MTFEEWKRLADKRIAELCYGFTSDDLPDFDYYSCWKAGYSPNDTAKDALDYARDF